MFQFAKNDFAKIFFSELQILAPTNAFVGKSTCNLLSVDGLCERHQEERTIRDWPRAEGRYARCGVGPNSAGGCE